MPVKQRAFPKPTYPIEKVEYDEDRPYVWVLTKKVGGKVERRRKYGELRSCTACGQRYMAINPKVQQSFCSRACAAQNRSYSEEGTVSLRRARPEKFTLKSMKDRADRLFSAAVRSRGHCQRCGSSDRMKLQCAHIISRRYLGTRWTWDNALCLCASCHVWGHQFPLEFEALVLTILSPERYAELKAEALGIRKMDEGSYRHLVGIMEDLVALHLGIDVDDRAGLARAIRGKAS